MAEFDFGISREFQKSAPSDSKTTEDAIIEEGELTCCPAHLIMRTSPQLAHQHNTKIVHIKNGFLKIGRTLSEAGLYVYLYHLPLYTQTSSNAYASDFDTKKSDIKCRSSPSVISRSHAIIKKENSGRWRIVDTRSTNGVFVNDVKVPNLLLKNGDIITFGGGGNLPFNTVKRQPDSECVYEFVCPVPKLVVIFKKKKRQSIGTADVNDEGGNYKAPARKSGSRPKRRKL